MVHKEQVILAMEKNMYKTMMYFPLQIPTFYVQETQEYILIDSGLNDNTFNIIGRTRIKKDIDRTIQNLISHFEQKKIPFAWWIDPSSKPTNLAHLLSQNGLNLEEKDAGMYLQLSSVFSIETPLIIKRVFNSTEIADFGLIHLRLNSRVSPYYAALSKIRMHKNSPVQMYVGYLDNIPVATGIVSFFNNVAGISSLMTIPEQRRKGFGTSMMQHLLNIAFIHTHPLAVLQANYEAIPLYKKIGFQEICTYKVFEKIETSI